jgi:hypothetical protein
MSDYINSYLYNFDENERFYKKSKETGFSKDSINSLFDVNDDGVFSAVEKDRAESVALINEMSSINPVIARAYNDVNFQIQNGSYLTKKQKNNGLRFYKAVMEAVKMNENENFNIDHNIKTDEPNEYIGEQPDNLQEYLKDRQALEENQIDNAV